MPKALKPTDLIALPSEQADEKSVMHAAVAQAGYGGTDQLGQREYEDRLWAEAESMAPDLDDMARENLGWEN